MLLITLLTLCYMLHHYVGFYDECTHAYVTDNTRYAMLYGRSLCQNK